MMRGPTYDDGYITRKMSSMHGPTFAPPGGAASYGRPPMGGYMQGYPPMGPPPRMAPRMGPPPPSYYDYDYGYGGGYGGGYPGGYGYGYAPPPPRMSRYETYMDEEVPEPTYTPRYRSRVPETLNEMDVRDRGAPAHHPHHQAMVPHQPPSVAALRDLPPMSVNDVDDEYCMQPRRLRKAHLQSSPGIAPPSHLHVPGETEGDRHLAKMQARYPSLSEPQMLQDHVDKMRIRLKSIAFSLDPSGPVPDIIVPERPRKGGAEGDKKYTQAIEYGDLPKVASRRQRYYPEDEYLKDNLRIKCLSHYKTTRTAADAQMSIVPSDSSTSRYDKLAGAKWEEPDTVFGTPSDKKPYSKVETGSSFFSTYGYTSRKKDYVGEKVRDYYYFGDEAKPLTDGTSEESDERKERRKKKKSKERDLPETPAIEASTTPAPPSDFSTTSEVESAAKEASIGDDEAIDEKELKRLEKKKRKAEREAAAKAAMEAELAALAAAEAELARLEAESSTLKTDSPAPPPEKVSSPVEVASTKAGEPSSAPASAEPATEVKSESAADKSE